MKSMIISSLACGVKEDMLATSLNISIDCVELIKENDKKAKDPKMFRGKIQSYFEKGLPAD